MARLQQIIRGKRQIRAVEIPLKNFVCEGEIKTVLVGLRVLSGEDYAVILSSASQWTLEHNGKSEPGNEIYDFAKAVYTIAVAAVDPDSDPSAPRPFFGASENPTVEERASDILKSELIGRDTILYLAEHQDVWQNECSPQPGLGTKTPEEWLSMVAGVVVEGPLAFLRLSAASRLNFLLATANLLLSLPALKSTSGSTAEPPKA